VLLACLGHVIGLSGGGGGGGGGEGEGEGEGGEGKGGGEGGREGGEGEGGGEGGCFHEHKRALQLWSIVANQWSITGSVL
jgi:hypothetical protein